MDTISIETIKEWIKTASYIEIIEIQRVLKERESILVNTVIKKFKEV